MLCIDKGCKGSSGGPTGFEAEAGYLCQNLFCYHLCIWHSFLIVSLKECSRIKVVFIRERRLYRKFIFKDIYIYTYVILTNEQDLLNFGCNCAAPAYLTVQYECVVGVCTNL